MLSTIRLTLYAVLAVFAFFTFALAAARIHYTTHLVGHSGDFYEPVVAEILATALLTMGWSIFVILVIYKRLEIPRVGTFIAEVVGLGVLFLFWIVGAGIASTAWGDISLCLLSACKVLASLLAFTWLSWIVVLALLITSLMFAIANKAWNEPLHGRWDPRVTHYYQ
jgi:hypothetical protein